MTNHARKLPRITPLERDELPVHVDRITVKLMNQRRHLTHCALDWSSEYLAAVRRTLAKEVQHGDGPRLNAVGVVLARVLRSVAAMDPSLSRKAFHEVDHSVVGMASDFMAGMMSRAALDHVDLDNVARGIALSGSDHYPDLKSDRAAVLAAAGVTMMRSRS